RLCKPPSGAACRCFTAAASTRRTAPNSSTSRISTGSSSAARRGPSRDISISSNVFPPPHDGSAFPEPIATQKLEQEVALAERQPSVQIEAEIGDPVAVRVALDDGEGLAFAGGRVPAQFAGLARKGLAPGEEGEGMAGLRAVGIDGGQVDAV